MLPSSPSALRPGGGGEGGGDRRIVVLLTGGTGDLALFRLSLQTLAQAFSLNLIETSDFIERHGPWDPGAGSPVTGRMRVHRAPDRATALGILLGGGGVGLGVAALAVPLLTRSLAAKASLGIDDDMPSAVLGAALERGIPVVAARSDADPASLRATPALQQGPNSLRNLLENYIQRLTAWGVRWTSVELLPGAVAGVAAGGVLGAAGAMAGTQGTTGTEGTQGAAATALSRTRGPALPGSAPSPGGGAPGRRRFITKEDMWSLLERGQMELRVCPDDIVTPEAEDFAASRGIRIVR